MATKAELESELSELRQQCEALKAEQTGAPPAEPSSDEDEGPNLSDSVQALLEEHGIESDQIKNASEQLVKEVSELQQKYPLAMLLGVFILGYAIGHRKG